MVLRPFDNYLLMQICSLGKNECASHKCNSKVCFFKSTRIYTTKLKKNKKRREERKSLLVLTVLQGNALQEHR